jgi:hypothetical protein
MTGVVKGYFLGLPIPAAGCTVATFVMTGLKPPGWMFLVLVAVFAYLMVSTVKYPDFKGKGEKIRPVPAAAAVLVGAYIIYQPAHGLGDRAVHVADGGEHSLAPVRVAAVTELQRFVLAGRGAARHRRTPEGAVVQAHVDLDGRVPAGVEDLAGVDVLDERHTRAMLPDAQAGSAEGRSWFSG